MLPDMSPQPITCHLFTTPNVRAALYRLHTRHAQDHDGLRTEHFSHGQEVLAPLLAQMFNHIVCHGFPPTWSTTTLVPISKAGDPMDSGNYHTLMIGHTLAKIYGLVLERELSTYTQAHGLGALGQAGF